MLNYYNEANSKKFFARTVNEDLSDVYVPFLERIPIGARILDLGCGSGRDSLVFAKRGYQVVLTDGSLDMCQLAEQHTGLPVRQMKFSGLDYKEEFEGIWANASLLHVSRKEIHPIIEKILLALKPNGVLFTSFKYGTGERFDDGRFFCDYTEESLRKLISEFGLTEIGINKAPGHIRGTRVDWLHGLFQKN